MSGNSRVCHLYRPDCTVCCIYVLAVFCCLCELLVFIATLSLRILWGPGWHWLFRRGFALTSASHLGELPTKKHFDFFTWGFSGYRSGVSSNCEPVRSPAFGTQFQSRLPPALPAQRQLSLQRPPCCAWSLAHCGWRAPLGNRMSGNLGTKASFASGWPPEAPAFGWFLVFEESFHLYRLSNVCTIVYFKFYPAFYLLPKGT